MCTLINYTDDREILLEGIKSNGIVERSFKEEKKKFMHPAISLLYIISYLKLK